MGSSTCKSKHIFSALHFQLKKKRKKKEWMNMNKQFKYWIIIRGNTGMAQTNIHSSRNIHDIKHLPLTSLLLHHYKACLLGEQQNFVLPWNPPRQAIWRENNYFKDTTDCYQLKENKCQISQVPEWTHTEIYIIIIVIFDVHLIHRNSVHIFDEPFY